MQMKAKDGEYSTEITTVIFSTFKKALTRNVLGVLLKDFQRPEVIEWQ